MSRSRHSNNGRIRRSSKQQSSQVSFRCVNCKQMISSLAFGTEHRNHCPLCLWSKHVDVKSGDRNSICRGKMEPISVWVKSDIEWALVHRCTSCAVLKSNRIAGDDNEFALMSLAAKAIVMPPFPLDRMP